jgi:translocator protein
MPHELDKPAAPAAPTPMHDRLAAVGWILLAGAAGAVGSIASISSREFYATIERPGWAPPGSVFGPVWTTLYILMGVAAWLVWRERPPRDSAAGRSRRYGLALFGAQLVLNALWTWLFFAWRQGGLAFVEIVVLWAAIAATALHFGRVRRLAGWLMLPYLAWVTFAAALTWAIWQANPGRL